jgi:alpha-amylase
MKNIIPLLFSAVIISIAVGCAHRTETQNVHASWTYNAVIYEMNVRQYTPEGTLKAASEQLPRLRKMGVDAVWIMPIHPIGVEGRKGTLGSYYAISDYKAINPEMGNMDDFDSFLEKAHSVGLKVIMDLVANHTSPDAVWTKEHKDWYMLDSLGNFKVDYDWTDIAKLDYSKSGLRKAMTDVMLFWAGKGIDGFRCDMASLVPDDFWKESIAKVRRDHPGFYFLAEGESPQLHEDGFDATYSWKLHHLMNDIAEGVKGVADLKSYLKADSVEFPRSAFRLMFTSNHDENSWKGSAIERMGDAAQTFAALTYVLPQSQPLIYTGQEIGLDRSLKFFDKDTVGKWNSDNDFANLYLHLNNLRHRHPCLYSGEKGGGIKIVEGMPDNLFCFIRDDARNDRIVCLFNLSKDHVDAIVPAGLEGLYDDVMTGSRCGLHFGNDIHLGPWQFKILERRL